MSAVPGGNRWAVLLASRAYRELRKLERDQNSLEAIHKKIKELSSGGFSFENHRVIIGTTKRVPLFRARAPFDLRIIYQVDVLPDSTGKRIQVVKILRIGSRAQIDYGFWVKVSARLQKVDPHYKDRCTELRRWIDEESDPPGFLHKNDEPATSAQDVEFQVANITEADMNEIQEITMERFAPLNKSLYNSIVADLNIVCPMILDEHEREVVNHSGASIVIGRSGTGKTTALIYKMRAIDQASVTQGTERGLRQMFVTRSRVLAQHVEATYQCLVQFTNIASKSMDELKEMARDARQDPDRALVEFDTEVDLRDDLPKQFSALQDSNFPLFISFDTLCSLLEADIRRIEPNQLGSPESRSLIGFNEFLHNYWPSFKGLTQGLEPGLVYSEIIGVIKGSQAASESADGYLSRKEYVDTLSYRQFPLPRHSRESVYSIFEIYSKNKRSRCETDPADRTGLILRYINRLVGKSKVDYLYVDEVQDNLMIDIYLLRSLAKTIDNIYWSGDSAQTVVAGSAFRINDLKAFTYRDQTDFSYARSARKAAAQFQTFELSVNFRSLSGIVSFARSVIQAIYDLFPNSIDPMEPEKAKDHGDPPTLFTNIRDEAGYFEDFLLGSNASNRVVFGAQQVILVRDARTADQLDARLQGLCSVLPIMDSKGLEFDDVLIYNFFSSSPVPASAWGYISGDQRSGQPPPPTLCGELKLLYVATTRARRRCWIWDSGQVIDRLKNFWVPRGLVQVEPASDMVGCLAVSSSNTQWAAKGREYFSHRMYKLASACFRQAGHENDAKISTAYHLMTRAKLKRLRGDTPSARSDLISAASKMEDCALLHGVGNTNNFYYHAATCYQSAQELRRAASAFIQASRPAYGIQILFDARDFKYGAQILRANRGLFEIDVYKSLREQARIHFFEQRDYIQINLLFASVDSQLNFARKHKFRTQLKHILETHHRYDELAEEYMIEKDVKQAVDWCFRAYQHHGTNSSIDRAVRFSITYAESVLPIEGTYQKNARNLAKSVVQRVQPYAAQSEVDNRLAIDMFYGYLCFNHVSLDLAQSWNQGSPTRTLACYLALQNNNWLQDDSGDVVLGHLDLWKTYKTDILNIAESPRPSNLPLAQKVLGFSIASTSPSTWSSVTVEESSLIHQRRQQFTNQSRAKPTPTEIDQILRGELPNRIHRMLGELHTAALSSHWTRPRSSSISPPRSLYHKPSSTTASDHTFSLKLYILCNIIGVLDISQSQSGRVKWFQDLTLVDQLWLRRMFDTAFLGTGEVGCFSVLRSIPNWENAAECLQNWLHRDWDELVGAELSGSTITHMLLHALMQSTLEAQVFSRKYPPGRHLKPIWYFDFDTDLGLPVHAFLFGLPSHKSPLEHDRGRFAQAGHFLTQLLSPSYRGRTYGADAAIVVHLIEMLSRELILHLNPSALPKFNKLLMPFSWIRALAHKYRNATNVADIQSLDAILSNIGLFSMILRFEAPGRLCIGGKQGNPAMVDMLNLRLCWCVALVIMQMGNHDERLGFAMEILRKLASDNKPDEYHHRHHTGIGLYHEFSTVTDRESCLRVLCRTLRHESLVLLLENSNQDHPAKQIPAVRVISCAEQTRLAEMLEELS